MFFRALALAASAVALLTAPVVDAHARLYRPEPEYTVADRNKNWSPLAFLESQGYKTTADFNGWRRSKGYKTLRDFMEDKKAYKAAAGSTFECGWTNPNAPAKPLPTDGIVRISGYGHEGPCEIWLDNVRVLQGDNCNKDFPGQNAKIDYSACKNGCMLRWYWLGIRPLEKMSWQVYKQCIPLKGSGARSLDDPEVGGEGEYPDEYAAAPAKNATANCNRNTD
ncbi:hypothetical protein Poli38472_008773 [Pythium oligandrum]|uniref:Uncharacterized protein n=1 Tax=Pythium oligandrum TaxID=41045 RepID=A0A8K1C470_PYTOL|nr:hypothetical protein Poli38472_008773 [Pythium oligandrum]|eukprot:TMW56125.1 hypothetical protein Poli38472_008773 [Pythium oligandrum]